MESVSSKIDKFIAENGGNERDALNVALARIEILEIQKADLLKMCDDSEPIGSLSTRIFEELQTRRAQFISDNGRPF